MRQPVINDVVKVTKDVPHLFVCKGQTGIVRSIWKPGEAYEIEFAGLDDTTRAVLLREQVKLASESETEETQPETGLWSF